MMSTGWINFTMSTTQTFLLSCTIQLILWYNNYIMASYTIRALSIDNLFTMFRPKDVM